MIRWLKRLSRFFLLLFLVGVCGLIWLFSTRDDFFFTLIPIEEQRTITQAFTTLEVTANTSDITIKTDHIPSAKLRLAGNVPEQNKDRIQFVSEVQANGSLVVKILEQETRPIFNPGNSKLHLEITLPDSEVPYESVHVETAIGDVAASSIQMKKGRFASHVGDIELTQITADDVQTKTDTGDTSLKKVQAHIAVESSIGDVKVLEVPELLHDIRVRTETGDVTISIAKQPAEATLDLKTSAGDVDVEWDQTQITTGGPTISARTSIGDIRIQ